MSDDLLIETFEKAMELNLDEDFCNLIEKEMDDRGLVIQYNTEKQKQNN
ncbi:sporulation histidine kinase inhibitor Sda [Lentibacillus sp. L22]|nr:sporulation histidine kinase inhibitor Sda [Lentibacillus daqui]